ncbi:MAG: dipeptide/oligopeptide/nickel ABC transporter ATP-binding protein, partial [bacterium]
MLEIKNLTKHFPINKSQTVYALDGVSFSVGKGRTLGIVGESGCGKSTCARTIMRIYEPTSGEIIVDGNNIESLSNKQLKPFRKDMQMIFQDPYASLNARMTVYDIIAEPLIAHNMYKSKAERDDAIYHMINKVGLTKEHANRYAHEFSGGQRQRIGISRALILNPSIIVC